MCAPYYSWQGIYEIEKLHFNLDKNYKDKLKRKKIRGGEENELHFYEAKENKI